MKTALLVGGPAGGQEVKWGGISQLCVEGEGPEYAYRLEPLTIVEGGERRTVLLYVWCGMTLAEALAEVLEVYRERK